MDKGSPNVPRVGRRSPGWAGGPQGVPKSPQGDQGSMPGSVPRVTGWWGCPQGYRGVPGVGHTLVSRAAGAAVPPTHRGAGAPVAAGPGGTGVLPAGARGAPPARLALAGEPVGGGARMGAEHPRVPQAKPLPPQEPIDNLGHPPRHPWEPLGAPPGTHGQPRAPHGHPQAPSQHPVGAHPSPWSRQVPWAQGLLRHGRVPGRHWASRVPGGQRQVKPLAPSTQVPPSWQGLEAHSLISTLQRGPGVGHGSGGVWGGGTLVGTQVELPT